MKIGNEEIDEMKLLDAIFAPASVAEIDYREYRKHRKDIEKEFVGPLKDYVLSGVDAEQDRIHLDYFDRATGIVGRITLAPTGDGGWDYEQAADLPEGSSMYILIPWLLGQFADLQVPSPAAQW